MLAMLVALVIANQSNVNLVLTEKPAYEKVTIVNNNNVTIRGLKCKTTKPTACVEIKDSKNVNLVNTQIVGGGLVAIRNSGLNLENTTITGGGNCAAIYDSTGFVVKNLKVTKCQIDGLDIWRDHEGLVDGLVCEDFNLVDDHHPDCLQFLSAKGQKPTSDITVQNSRATGAMQGFGAFDHGTGGYDNLRFYNNVANTSYNNGLYLVECRNCVAHNNRVSTYPGAQYRTSITFTRSSVDRCGNVIEPGAGKKGVVEAACANDK